MGVKGLEHFRYVCKAIIERWSECQPCVQLSRSDVNVVEQEMTSQTASASFQSESLWPERRPLT